MTSAIAQPACTETQPAKRHPLWLWLAGTVLLASWMIQLSPPAQMALELSRPAVQAGQAWRLLTGQLTHYDWSQWAADAAAFAVLCWVGRRRGGLAAAVLVSAVAVGLAVQWGAGAVSCYRGLSGISYGLMAWLLVRSAVECRGLSRAAWLVGLAGLTVKSVLEVLGQPLPLPVPLPAGVGVVGWSHLAGLLAGGAVAGSWRTLVR